MEGGSDLCGAKLFALRFAILVFVIGGCGRSDASRPASPTSRASPAAEEMFTYTLPPEGRALGDVTHDAEVATGFTLIPSDGMPLRDERAFMAGEVRAPRSQAREFFEELLLSCQCTLWSPEGVAGQRFNVEGREPWHRRMRATRPFVWKGNLGTTPPVAGQTVITVFLLHHTEPAALREPLDALCAANGSATGVEEVAEQKAIYAYGSVPTLRKMQQVIAALDVPAAQSRPASVK